MRSSSSRGVLAPLRDSLRTQLWPLPILGVTLAVAAGVGLPRLDAAVDDELPPSVTVYLFSGGAEAARAVLSAVAGSLITVTSLTFSLTVVTLQLASSQFSPRLLRTFTRDRFVHVTLALFLATFSYALTVLRTVRGGEGDGDGFVPEISVTVAFLLAMASVAALVLFLAHLAREIRVETMLERVHTEAGRTLRAVLGEHDGTPPCCPEPPRDAVPLPARSSGFLVHGDEDELLSAAVDADAVVLVDRAAGASLVAGIPFAVAWPLGAGALEPDGRRALAKRVAAAVTTGAERTQVEDVAFGLRQLTDVAVKALSPGINDPTTARHALRHTSALLCELAGRDLGPRILHDDRGAVRVILRRPAFADLLELALGQPRRYGASDPEVLAGLFEILTEVAWAARDDEQRGAVADQLGLLRTTAGDQHPDAAGYERLDRLAERIEHALAGRWETSTTAS